MQVGLGLTDTTLGGVGLIEKCDSELFYPYRLALRLKITAIGGYKNEENGISFPVCDICNVNPCGDIFQLHSGSKAMH
jgi:hypothetical protein